MPHGSKIGLLFIVAAYHVILCHQLNKSIYFYLFNSFFPGQNGRYFSEDIFKCIFMNENFCILIQISLTFVPNGLIDNSRALVQLLAGRQTYEKPLPEPLLIQFTDAYMRH